METLNLATLQALAEVPVEVLRALAGVRPEVLLALREVPLEVLQTLCPEGLQARANTAAASPLPSPTAAGTGPHGSTAETPPNEADPRHLWASALKQFQRALLAISTAGNNVVGHVGAYDGQPWWDLRTGRSADRLLDLPDYQVAQLFSVLGNEVRLAMLRTLLTAPRSAAELVAELGLGTTGQAYHHLRELERAGFIEQRDGRYAYADRFKRVYLAALGLAAGAGAATADDTGTETPAVPSTGAQP